MPSSLFQYLQNGVRYVTADGMFAQNFRVYWQEFVDRLTNVISGLQATDAEILDILVRLGLVEVLADGTFDIVDQGLESDGTVKPNKVVTASVVAEAITAPAFYAFADATIPDTGAETTIGTTGTETVGDATYGGAMLTMQFVFDNSTDTDAGAEIYLETQSNGGAWVRHADATVKVGARTGGASDTEAYIPVNQAYPVAGAGLSTIAARMVGKAIIMPSGAATQASDLLKPAIIIAPLKR